jgi:hypothetical protein
VVTGSAPERRDPGDRQINSVHATSPTGVG